MKFSEYKQQLQTALQNSDYSLFTRRSLDACRDYNLSKSLEEEVFELRKNYLYLSIAETPDFTDFNAKCVELVGKFNEQNDFPEKDFENKLVVKAQDISKQFYKGKSPFKLHTVSFELYTGQITGVVGENGNGKTTLLRIVAGQLSTDTGSITYPYLSSKNSFYDSKNQFAFIPQRIAKWHGTLMENLQFFASIHNIVGSENYRQIDFILYRLGLDRFRDLTWNEISSGYRMRFELAKMLLWRPKLLILDEPLANLDINAQQLLLQDLKFFTQSSTNPISIILSSQQLHEIERVADNIIFIRQGKTIYNGKQQNFGQDRVLNSFELAGNFNLAQLQAVVKNLGIKVEDAGTSFIIESSKDTNWFSILEVLNQNNFEVNYFRNISQSTRQLFHKDI